MLLKMSRFVGNSICESKEEMLRVMTTYELLFMVEICQACITPIFSVCGDMLCSRLKFITIDKLLKLK